MRLKAFKMIVLLLVLVALYAFGFFLFVHKIPKETGEDTLADALEKTQALVVFTGGSKRIEMAKELVKSGFEGSVLITGVADVVTPEMLLADIDEDKKSRYVLDYTATSTQENIFVTKRFMEEHHLQVLGLITSSYHMPRSLMLLQSYAPQLRVITLPVYPDDLPTSFLIREYHKYLASHLGGL